MLQPQLGPLRVSLRLQSLRPLLRLRLQSLRPLRQPLQSAHALLRLLGALFLAALLLHLLPQQPAQPLLAVAAPPRLPPLKLPSPQICRHVPRQKQR